MLFLFVYVYLFLLPLFSLRVRRLIIYIMLIIYLGRQVALHVDTRWYSYVCPQLGLSIDLSAMVQYALSCLILWCRKKWQRKTCVSLPIVPSVIVSLRFCAVRSAKFFSRVTAGLFSMYCHQWNLCAIQPSDPFQHITAHVLLYNVVYVLHCCPWNSLCVCVIVSVPCSEILAICVHQMPLYRARVICMCGWTQSSATQTTAMHWMWLKRIMPNTCNTCMKWTVSRA